jgi:hypothetical protein
MNLEDLKPTTKPIGDVMQGIIRDLSAGLTPAEVFRIWSPANPELNYGQVAYRARALGFHSRRGGLRRIKRRDQALDEAWGRGIRDYRALAHAAGCSPTTARSYVARKVEDVI